MTTNAICVYDFTSHDMDVTCENIKSALREYCKHWAFQLEKGEIEGRLHWQGRFSLKVKERLTGVYQKFSSKLNSKDWHLSPTSKENQDNMFYVMKEDTKVEGPWTDKDKIKVIPIQLVKFYGDNAATLFPWQLSIWNRIMQFDYKKLYWNNENRDLSKLVIDDRHINLIYCSKGNSGKSTICQLLAVEDKAHFIPFCNDYKDIMRMVMDRPKLGAYLIDMPRAINKDKLYQLFSGIETIKGGYCYDDRYEFRDEHFDTPQIFVFTNKLPDISLLSEDRWLIWEIIDNILVNVNVKDVLKKQEMIKEAEDKLKEMKKEQS